jgi:holin-like protein
MLATLGLLLACQLAGEIIVRGLLLPLPGPVLGLCLLAMGLFGAERFGKVSRATVEMTPVGKTAAGLLGLLGLLFVPAGVGIIEHGAVFRTHGLALMLALVVSTVLTLLVTVFVFLWAASWTSRKTP